MKRTFTRLAIENFKSFLGCHEIDLEWDGPGLYYIRGRNEAEPRMGSNGAGKSSIWDALCWCLYGRSPRGLKNTDVRPWFGKGQTHVSVEYLDEDGVVHNITRTAGPNSLELDARTVGQEQIDKAMGMSVAVFTNTVLLGQGRPLFLDLKPEQKMSLLSEALDLERWDVRSAATGKEVAKLENELAGCVGEKDAVERQITQTEQQLEELKTLVANWEEQRAGQKAGLTAELKELDGRISKLQKIAAQADITHDSALTELRALGQTSASFERRALALSKESGVFTAARELASRQLATAQADLCELGSGSHCPTCGQPLKGTSLAKHRAELQAKCAELEKQANAKVPKKLADAIAKLHKELEDAEKHENQFRDKAAVARDTLLQTNTELARLQARAAEARRTMQEGESRENPHRPQVSKCRQRCAELQTDLGELGDYITWLERKIARTRFWVKGFKDVRLYIVEDVLQELQLVSGTLLEELGLDDWGIEYAIERETAKGSTVQGLSVLIYAPDLDEPTRWENWSGGEEQRLKLVGSLALAEVLLSHAGVEPNLEILDEPSRGMSVEGIYDLCDALADRAASHGRHIFYTDHRVIETTQFAGVMTVIKDRHGSYVARV